MLAALLAIALTADAPKPLKPVSLHAVTASGVVLDFESAPGPCSITIKKMLPLFADGGDTEVVQQLHQTCGEHTRQQIDGLQPFHVYTYVVTAPGVRPQAGSMRPSPPPGSTSAFRFAVVGDARDHAKWADLARALEIKDPFFILDTGDNIEGGDSRERWRDFYVAADELFKRVPYFSVRGNHDQGANYAEYNPAPATGIGPSTYAFQYGNAGFIAIDSNAPEDPAQLAFVTRALNAMKGGPIFVFQHHPLYSCGGHGSSERMQRAFKALFEQAHVAYDFAGHDHDLIDWKPLNGVRYAVSGGGGATTYPMFGCGDAQFSKQSFGFILVTVEGAKVSAVFYDEHGIELYRDVFKAAGASIPAVDLAALARPQP